ncbi:MAG: cytochrome C biogenesis protein [Lachnospiraceae bacterium]|nr:cytochrome C biogenesis protein [Lachnospiraceae bacterium]
MEYDYVKLEIFIPESHLDVLSKALRKADAGHIGRYDCVLSYSKVTSTWRPLEGADPYSGTIGVLSEEEECKVEVTVEAARLDAAIDAVRRVHPYEEPVINAIPLLRPMHSCV